MIINDLDDYYIVFDTKNRNTELDTLINKNKEEIEKNIFVYFYLLIFYNRVAAYWILAKYWYSNKNE